MPYSKADCLRHIQSTVDLLYAFEEWENTAFVKALALGIQGKKREARMAGTKDENIAKYLQSEAGDMFETEIYPKMSNSKFPSVDGIEAFMMEYRNGLWDMYGKLHESANTFVTPLCLADVAQPLYKQCRCIKCALVDINRKIKRWNDMKEHGTALHDLYIYETSEYNNHDAAEAKEGMMGYKH